VGDRYRLLQRALLFAYLGYQLVYGIVAGWDEMWRSSATGWVLGIVIAGCLAIEVVRFRRRRSGGSTATFDARVDRRYRRAGGDRRETEIAQGAAGGDVPGRARLVVRSTVGCVWITLRNLLPDGDDAHEPIAPPERGAGTDRGRLRLEHLFRFGLMPMCLLIASGRHRCICGATVPRSVWRRLLTKS
jgi:hypothetical protein